MTVHSRPTRPVLRYHGGKWKLAPWVLQFLPPHRTYVEPFGGAASVLLRKPRSFGEVYNDLDGTVVTLFRVLQDPARAAELERRVRYTAFARDEFNWSYTPAKDAIDEAHKMIVRSFMGFGSASMTRTHKTGFRFNANRSGTTPATDWGRWPAQIVAFTERLRGVIIENRPATDVLVQHDGPLTLHYVDPPYPHSTRSSMRDRTRPGAKHSYRHEMTDADHRALAATLRALTGMVVLSGYACPLYDVELFPDWVCTTRRAYADGAKVRTECLWLNPAAAAQVRDMPARLSEAM